VKTLASVVGIGLLLSVGGARAQSDSALQSDPRGWLDLLPGVSLRGWTRVPIPPGKAPDPVSQWKVDPVNRFLVCEGTGGHEWLRYDREFTDFIFHVEWRFTKRAGAKGYNSGIFVRNSADGVLWHQAQVGAGSGGFLFGDTLVDGAKQRINLSSQLKENRVKEAGEWNTYELRCKAKTVTVWVNGAVTSECTTCDVPKGYVGLEAEGYRIEFRNLMLKELP